MSLEYPPSNNSLCNQQEADSEVAQTQCSEEDSQKIKPPQEFDVNAHGHKPTQLTRLSVEMGDSTDVNKTDDTNTGEITEEQRGVHTAADFISSDVEIRSLNTNISNAENLSPPVDTESGTDDTQVEKCATAGKEELSKIFCNDNSNQREIKTGIMKSEGDTGERETSSYCEYKEISSDDNIEDDHEDLTEKVDVDSSTSSPSQISPDHHHHTKTTHEHGNQQNGADEDTDVNAERPDSLSLPRPLQYIEKQKYKMYHKRGKSDSSFASDVSRSSSTDALIEEASRTPLSSQGTITKDGDMIAFVAEGLNDLIKLSSPLSQTDSSVSSSLRSPGEKSVSSVSSSTSAWSDVTSSASEWSRDYSRMSRKPGKPASQKQTESPSILTASPDDIPPVDPRAVMDLEMHAVKVADSVDHMLGTLKNNLYKMSALSYHCLDAYKDAVDSTCDSVDSSIKCMYALMAKCEELSKTMKPVYALQTQVKEIERLLDLFEGQIAKEDK